MDDTGGEAAAASSGWIALRVGVGSAAAMAADGSLTCWGDPEMMNTTCPEGTFVDFAMGYAHGCALDAAGEVTCWGCDDPESDYYWTCVGQTEAPAGPFVSIAAGSFETCALDAAGGLTCWGGYGLPRRQAPSTGTYTKVALGGFGCAITTDQEIVCWGTNDYQEMWHPMMGRWVDVAVGTSHACALTDRGDITCWGGNGPLTRTPPEGVRFRSLGADLESTCGITMAGGIRCWEDYTMDDRWVEYLDPEVPPGTFTTVDIGWPTACALSTAGAIECFGYTRGEDLADHP